MNATIVRPAHSKGSWTAAVVCAGLVALLGWTAPTAGQDPATEALDAVRLDQRLGEAVPLDMVFTDEKGRSVSLRRYFADGPVVLVPVYYNCPMLCTQVLNTLTRAVRPERAAPGRDFEIVVFSIDPREQPTLAAQKKLRYTSEPPLRETQSGWHFLTGEQPAIRRITDAIGFFYQYDPETERYAHPAAMVLLTQDGRISRYLLGLDVSQRDLHLSLVESSEGRIGSLSDRIVLRCYQYDPETGRYGFAVMGALRAASVLTLLGLGATVALCHRRRRSRLASSETWKE